MERVQIDEATLEPKYKVIGVEGWNTEHAEFKGLVKGICGSAIIDAVAELFRAGIVDSRGKFRKDAESKRVREGESGWEYVIAWAEETIHRPRYPHHAAGCEADSTREGGAVTAARTLLKRMNLHSPDKIILAGGFGSYIDKEKAMLIGLIPDCELPNVYAVGNAAGDGARMTRALRARSDALAAALDGLSWAASEALREDWPWLLAWLGGRPSGTLLALGPGEQPGALLEALGEVRRATPRRRRAPAGGDTLDPRPEAP